jgi:hypothetical protein
MHRTQIYLPKTQLTKLRAEARKRDTSVSEVVRFCIQKEILGNKPKNTSKQKKSSSFFEDTKEVRKELEKLENKGPKDLASRVDYYYYGQI